MLLANLTKAAALDHLISLHRSNAASTAELSTSRRAMDQLMDCFVKEIPGKPAKDYDYLSYVFADLSRHESGRKYFLSRQDYDGVVPISKLTVFTSEENALVRRKGVASTVKNISFDINAHDFLLSDAVCNLLPYVLLPLAAGTDELSEEDTENMLPDLQLLPHNKHRDSDPDILATHLETLLLLTSTRQGRDHMRRVKVYPVIRECHLHVEDENVREAGDRLVQVLLRKEPDSHSDTEKADTEADTGTIPRFSGGTESDENDSEDNKIVEIF